MFSIGNLCNCVPAEVQMYGHIKKKRWRFKGQNHNQSGNDLSCERHSDITEIKREVIMLKQAFKYILKQAYCVRSFV